MRTTKIHPHLLSVKLGLILVLCIATVYMSPAQNLDVSRSTVTKIADLLNRFPADNSTAFNTAMKQMADFGEEELSQMALMLSENNDNTNLEYALSGFAFKVSQDINSEQAKRAVHAYGKALDQVNYDEAKAFLIENLRVMGSNDAVAYLSPYLDNERLASPAARALASIDTPQAEQALLTAMDSEEAEAILLPLIQALGDMKSQAAAPLIEPFLLSGNEAIKKVSIYSLANIGAPSSAKIVENAAQAADFKYENTHAASEYLNYIKNLAANGETKTAVKLAKKLHKSANNGDQIHTRAGALNLLASLDGARSAKLLQKAALSPHAAYRNTAMDLAQKDMGSDIQTWAKILRKADDPVKVHLIRRLGGLEGDAVLAVVKPYLQNDNPEIKKQAIASGVLLGEDKILPEVLALINTSSSEELEAIKVALLTMDGKEVSNEVAKNLSQASDEGKVILIEVLAARPSAEHMEVILAEIGTGNAEVKKAALAALYRLADPSHLDQLVTLLKSQQNPEELKEVQKAIIAANSQQSSRSQQTDWTLKTLQSLDKNKQIYLYDVLASTGGTKALNSLNEIYQKGDTNQKKAALTALANWPDAEAMDALFAIAKNDNDQDNAEKALEGYINLIRATSKADEGKVLMLRKALEVAKGTTNKQLVLRQLAQYPTFQALLVSGSYLDDPAVQQQAARAVMAIALADPSIYGKEVSAIVQKTRDVISGQDSEYHKTSLQKHLDEMPTDEGFTALFNGENLDGWKGLVANPIKRQAMSAAQLKREQAKADEEMRSGWTVENGLLVFTGKGNNLATEKNYGDFEMLVDWKITEEGDAGIYLRGTPQVQIWDTALVEVGAEVGSGGLYNNQTHPSKPIKVADNSVGEWNTFYIKMVGDRVTVELNGELVVDNVVLENYWDRSLPIFPEEQIELQAHGTYVAYRDIYIRELPQSNKFELSEEEKKEGYEVLFDGEHLDKWVGNKTDYVIEDGVIVIYPDRGGKGNLFTEKEYGDFVFRFEFKLTPGANNGLGIRAPLLGDAAYAGMELQILDNTADIYKNLEQYQYHGSLYGIAAAKKGFLNPVGEWNYQEVRVKGDVIQVILNGTEILNVNIAAAKQQGTLDKREHSGLHRDKGHIGFLGHGDVVYFRNIRVKDLSK
jgi:hypothetical protein